MALNRGRHLCLAGRPSGWALAHILVHLCFSARRYRHLHTRQTYRNRFSSVATRVRITVHYFHLFSCQWCPPELSTAFLLLDIVSHLSAFEVSYKNALYKSTAIIILLLSPRISFSCERLILRTVLAVTNLWLVKGAANTIFGTVRRLAYEERTLQINKYKAIVDSMLHPRCALTSPFPGR